MSEESSIEAFRNIKSGKLFILVDDSAATSYKLVNPEGKVVSLPDRLFEEDAEVIPEEDMAKTFPPEQLQAYEEYQKQAVARAEWEAETERRRKEEQKKQPSSTSSQSSTRGSQRRRTTKRSGSRTGLGAHWSSGRLTFYKHRIDPLDPKQTFRVTVSGTGTYEMTKDDFLRTFNDVVMSDAYRRDGYFAYSTVPEKAERFRKPTE